MPHHRFLAPPSHGNGGVGGPKAADGPEASRECADLAECGVASPNEGATIHKEGCLGARGEK